ncbi:helix-turn-helix domain-containing protein [Paenibacillus sp. FSL L8-0436]|uniref:helix-turn-helix domain-containing protein n=1 Tax=Paenibacillus sp. FSL L8-0436 TaxID=2954686 RepID=UPI0031595D5C
MTNGLMTREQYVAKMSAGEWAEDGAIAREYRILFGFTIAEVASGIGVSPSTVGRYERGLPIQSARLLGSAYFLFLGVRRLQAEKAATSEADAWNSAEYLIDDNGDGSGVVLKKREYKTVGEISTGDPAFDAELAIAFCEKEGASYFVTY